MIDEVLTTPRANRLLADSEILGDFGSFATQATRFILPRRKGIRIQFPHSAKSEADQSTARGETPKISFALGGLSYSGRSECWGSTVWPNATALPSPSRACVLPRLKAAGRLQVPDAAF